MTIVEPLSPGPIDRHNSIFHPEKLQLKWAKPPNNTRVNYYSIAISNPSSSNSFTAYSNELLTNHRFQPGTNYTVTIRSRSYNTYSQSHTEVFKTLREFVFLYGLGKVLIPLAYCIYIFYIDVYSLKRYSFSDNYTVR